MNKELALRTFAYLIGHYKTHNETTINEQEIEAIEFILNEIKVLEQKVKKQQEIINKAIDFYEIYKQECVTGRTRDERLIRDYYLPAHLSKKLIEILKGDDYAR